MADDPQTTVWDGYPPNKTGNKYHWLQVSPAVLVVAIWDDGMWRCSRFGRLLPSEVAQWRYVEPVKEPANV